jgi:hypothetical protein
VHWAAVEDVVAGLGWLPAAAELEYHRPILPASRPRLLAAPAGEAGGGAGSWCYAWLLDGTERLASGRLARWPRASDPSRADDGPAGGAISARRCLRRRERR